MSVQDETELKDTVCKSLVDFLEVDANKVSLQVSSMGLWSTALRIGFSRF